MSELSQESANAQIDLLLDYYEIELEKDLKAEDSGAVEAKAERIRAGLTKAILKGRLEIAESCNDKGVATLSVVQTLRVPVGSVEKLTYGEVTGRCRTAVKDVDKGAPAKKMYDLLGAICGKGPQVIMALGGVDLKTAELLAAIFFLV